MMNWWRPHTKRNVSHEQMKADKALELSHLAQEVAEAQVETLGELVPALVERVGVLDRINRENNFGTRLAMAYREGR